MVTNMANTRPSKKGSGSAVLIMRLEDVTNDMMIIDVGYGGDPRTRSVFCLFIQCNNTYVNFRYKLAGPWREMMVRVRVEFLFRALKF